MLKLCSPLLFTFSVTVRKLSIRREVYIVSVGRGLGTVTTDAGALGIMFCSWNICSPRAEHVAFLKRLDFIISTLQMRILSPQSNTPGVRGGDGLQPTSVRSPSLSPGSPGQDQGEVGKAGHLGSTGKTRFIRWFVLNASVSSS